MSKKDRNRELRALAEKRLAALWGLCAECARLTPNLIKERDRQNAKAREEEARRALRPLKVPKRARERPPFVRPEEAV